MTCCGGKRAVLLSTFTLLASVRHALVITSQEISNDIEDMEDVGNEIPLAFASLPSFSPRLAEPRKPLFSNATHHSGEDCNRVCVAGDRRVCHFELTLELYQAMGVACGGCAAGVLADCESEQCVLGDGVEKGVLSINRQIPGPPIRVCKDDAIVVDVHNRAHGTAAAIHWHGLHMRETPFSDGVPFVTQCPVPFATSFRYWFQATEAGTQFYHSHSGHQKVNGQYGALIVREPPATTANADAYDFDLPQHYLLVSDWMHSYGEQLFPGLPSSGGIRPDSVLINGRGVYTNPITGKRTFVPPTRYYVTPGKRYRFRMINAVSHACPFALQIQQHKMTVIASDSYNLEPRDFGTIVSNAGERYDFVVTANHSQGDFWIRVRGIGVCALFPTESFALLRYVSNDADADEDTLRPLPPLPDYNEFFAAGTHHNQPTDSCYEDEVDGCITEMRALEEDADLRYSKPDHQFFLSFHNYRVPNEEIFRPGKYNQFVNLFSNLTIVGGVNNLSLVFPPSPPLTQPENIVESLYCDAHHWPEQCIGNRLCGCVHRLKIRLGSIVELFIMDSSEGLGIVHHPFHLHGYRFMVTGVGRHPLGLPLTAQLLEEMERSGMVPRLANNTRPPFKDTISIPNQGYTVVRLRADNPGFWLMHCHYEWHLAIGMGLILQVGQLDEMVPPPQGFPKCGNYLPSLE